MYFQDDIPSILIDYPKYHFLLVFGLTSIQDATEKCHYPKLVGEPLRLKLSFTFLLEHFTELHKLGNECFWLQLTSLVLSGRISEIENVSLEQIFDRIPLLKYRYFGSFPSDGVPTLDIDTFAIINTQSSNMQGEHWIMIAKFRHEMYFADSLGYKKYRFLEQ